MALKKLFPDYIFEVSWEVCNKVGGIHTVISSKTPVLADELKDNIIMVGPDVWKKTGEHPEFKEDKSLFVAWRNHALKKGFKVKAGRWKIAGNPIVLLIDFTPFIQEKDEIFKNLWLDYQVDSLAGEWDYIEPALFGYAAGKIMECFYHYHFTFSDKIIVQFHEWLSGVALLYLNKRVPQIATVFTTHATIVGRSIANNGLPFYNKLESYNPDKIAHDFNIIAKKSLEKISALNADCFTTVSEITAKECVHFLDKKPDFITPNGFDELVVPNDFFYKEKRVIARKKLLVVAKNLLDEEIADDVVLVIQSGRYEFRNKGIDLFIDALGEMNRNGNLKKEIISFIFVPAHNTGARRDLVQRMEGDMAVKIEGDHVLTHYLQGAEHDAIYNHILKNDLDNAKEKLAKVIFVPEYINDQDGIFNMNYYDLLIGFDLSVFPSYYEPWGYTPQESLAFHVPAITTTLSGFGIFMKSKSKSINDGIEIVFRDDTNDKEVQKSIQSIIENFANKNPTEIVAARDAAFELSKITSWKKFIVNYNNAYHFALEKAAARAQHYSHDAQVHLMDTCSTSAEAQEKLPTWRRIFVQPKLPQELEPLHALATNLWWSWNNDAIALFVSVDEKLWSEHQQNPVALLNNLSNKKMKELSSNEAFLLEMNTVLKKFDAYMNRTLTASPQVAYFCMEYGLSATLKLYAGGLGILAGDYLKEVSDNAVNMVAVGLLYRSGYFKQEISEHGDQLVHDDTQRFTNLPLSPVHNKDGEWLKIGIAIPGRTVYIKIWKVSVGLVPLYLMDTDITENSSEDRLITAHLYGGDNEYRLKQEMVLGIGGVLLLKELAISPDVFHYNEGHAAFAGLERLVILIQEKKVSLDEGFEIVRSSSLFTTHTPVAAGHDQFAEDLIRIYLSFNCDLLNISWKQFMALGRINENNNNDKIFSMSYLAAHLSQEINGVSKIHEDVSRKLFSPLWKGYAEEELNVGHVTNGVHYPTWTAPEWQSLHEKYFDNISESSSWQKIYDVKDKELWYIHLKLKNKLIDKIKAINEGKRNFDLLNEQTLIVGFARRFALYKRSDLLFNDLDRLEKLLSNSATPIVFLFAGKAHPKDTGGQDLIKHIIEITKQDRFKNHIMFLNGYDIELAKHLTQGVDLWLNTPEPGKEASGTSGMKAALNGVLNCSVPDGWWAEAHTLNPEGGWTLPIASTFDNIQNQADSEFLYQLFENEIIPHYFNRNKENIPEKWILKMKHCIASIAPQYTSRRMLKDYGELYYSKLFSRTKKIAKNNFEAVKQLSVWKQKIIQSWNTVKIISSDIGKTSAQPFPRDAEFNPHIILDLGELSMEDVAVEILFIDKRKDDGDFNKIIFKQDLIPTKQEDGTVSYTSKIPIVKSGVFEYGFRIYPKNTGLAYQQDISLLKWV